MELFWILYLTISLYLLSPTFCAYLPDTYNSAKNSVRKSKLSLADSAEWTEYYVREPEGPGTYSFGYDVEDSSTGNVQFRTEERRSNGTVTGSYGYVTPEGNIHVVHYTADHLGYRAKVEDGRIVKSPIKNRKAVDNSQDMSPQMLAALQSLETNLNSKKEDQRLRPVDNIKSNTHSNANFARLPVKEKRNGESIIYEVRKIPPYLNNS